MISPNNIKTILMRYKSALFAAPLLLQTPGMQRVGTISDGGFLVATLQELHPAGTLLPIPGRPVDMAVDEAHGRLYIKESRDLIVVDMRSKHVVSVTRYPNSEGASMHGIALSRDGKRLYLTTAEGTLCTADLGTNSKVQWTRNIRLPGLGGKGNAGACGLVLNSNETRVVVCLSISNQIATVNLINGKVERLIDVGVAPYDVKLTQDEKLAYVTDWGGRKPTLSSVTAPSAGTPTRVDKRGVACDGAVSVVDLVSGRSKTEIPIGLHPSELELSRKGLLYVANANSDTVSVIDCKKNRLIQTVSVRPKYLRKLAGSAPNALKLSLDEGRLYVANGGSNTVSVFQLDSLGKVAKLVGSVPTGWYPCAVACTEKQLVIASVKGVGSRRAGGSPNQWNISQTLGTITFVDNPSTGDSGQFGGQGAANETAGHRLALSGAGELSNGNQSAELNLRSAIRHVVYILKENRTYDQVFGDMDQGDNAPELTMFGQRVTPNHHAIARQFVLLDNYYCNGSISADGHSWATEGNCTDHLEKSFGGFVRSYTFGDDPLTYSASGFIWDNVINHGLSFQNFGEMDYAETEPRTRTFLQNYQDFNSGKPFAITHKIGISNLLQYSVAEYPGWNLRIPDVLRARIFLKRFRDMETQGKMPSLTLIYLPNDHTSGATPGSPTPRAQVADNDLALGQIVDAISHSKFWKDTCIFVNEDDPQDGRDHVDGHRSLCLVVSPYAKRASVVSRAYNQTSVLHTMEAMLGLPPLNQMDFLSPIMTDCFTGDPDMTPYQCLQNNIDLDEINPPVALLTGRRRTQAQISARLNLSKPDANDDDLFNNILETDAELLDTEARHQANNVK